MTCQECIEVLFEDQALFGESSGGEVGRSAVMHLTECEDCRDLARELRANAVTLRAMRDDAMPEPGRPLVVKPSRPRYFYPWVAAAALAVAVGLGGWWSSSHPSEVDQQASVEAAPQPARPSAAAAMPTQLERTNSGSSNQQTAAVLRSVKRDATNPLPTTLFKNLRAVAMPTTDPAHPAPVKILTGNPNVVIYLLMGETSVESNDEGEAL